uniref:ZZ-type domain-containing protein n=1 Tax=Acrobeloides nanus TaxID=290746 RepID=A0A914C3W3_9BILA
MGNEISSFDSPRSSRSNDLLQFSSILSKITTEAVMKHDATCDVCKQYIYGTRYKCIQCDNYDLCNSCLNRDCHNHHAFVRIATPRTQRPNFFEMQEALREYRIASSSGRKIRIICDACEEPIHGVRFTCLTCEDYDLCETCEQKGSHSMHPMLRIKPNIDARNPTSIFNIFEELLEQNRRSDDLFSSFFSSPLERVFGEMPGSRRFHARRKSSTSGSDDEDSQSSKSNSSEENGTSENEDSQSSSSEENDTSDDSRRFHARRKSSTSVSDDEDSQSSSSEENGTSDDSRRFHARRKSSTSVSDDEDSQSSSSEENDISDDESTDDESEPNEIHTGIDCDECSKRVKGIRYKCVECPDYDLCNTCEDCEQHTYHTLIRLVKPITSSKLREYICKRKDKILDLCKEYANTDLECDECERDIDETFFVCVHCKEFTICRDCEQDGKHAKHVMIRSSCKNGGDDFNTLNNMFSNILNGRKSLQTMLHERQQKQKEELERKKLKQKIKEENALRRKIINEDKRRVTFFIWFNQKILV